MQWRLYSLIYCGGNFLFEENVRPLSVQIHLKVPLFEEHILSTTLLNGNALIAVRGFQVVSFPNMNVRKHKLTFN